MHLSRSAPPTNRSLPRFRAESISRNAAMPTGATTNHVCGIRSGFPWRRSARAHMRPRYPLPESQLWSMPETLSAIGEVVTHHARQDVRTVGNQGIDAQVEQSSHLFRLIDRPHMYLFADGMGSTHKAVIHDRGIPV